MEPILDFLRSLHGEHLKDLIQAGGFALVAAIVFAETGLLAGFFLPGDSLLFVAGFLVGSSLLKPPAPLPQDPVSGWILLSILLMVAAFVGNSTGYWVGAKAGPRLFDRPDSRFFKKEHLIKTREFYEKHGAKTIILAEFMPFARTFAPVVAGIAQLPYRRFMTFNLLGVVIWINSMTLLGFTLGNASFDLAGHRILVREHIEKVIFAIVFLSVLPAIIHLIKARKGGGKDE
jgi:membrane-associated protein